jgi:hypothetical protein
VSHHSFDHKQISTQPDAESFTTTATIISIASTDNYTKYPDSMVFEATDDGLVLIDPKDLPVNVRVLTVEGGYDEYNINLEDKWIDKPFHHPFDQAECLVALPSSPHPSEIMAAYYDPAF